jgi:hypothetical protein
VQRDDVHTGEKELDVHVGRQLVLPEEKQNAVALNGVRSALIWPSPMSLDADLGFSTGPSLVQKKEPKPHCADQKSADRGAADCGLRAGKTNRDFPAGSPFTRI